MDRLLNHEWIIPTTMEILEKHDLPVVEIKNLINRGFFFENKNVYESANLLGIRHIMDQSLDQNTIEQFMATCDIRRFGGKRNIANEVFRQFKELIELDV